MKKYHVVIDTNVLVSALLSHSIESPVRRIWSYINEGIIIPVYNGDIISEYGDVLSRDKFGFDISDINNVLRLITETGDITEAIVTECEFSDKDDKVFYDVMQSDKSFYLVTGNIKHFPKSRRILIPSELIQIIDSGEKPEEVLNCIVKDNYGLRNQIIYEGDKSFERMHLCAMEKGLDSMSLDTINALIAEVRSAATIID